MGIAALFIGQLTPSLGFITSLARQLHIPLFLSSPDPQTKVEYYIINVYPHYTTTSQAFSDLIKFQQWDELAIITERAGSKFSSPRMELDLALASDSLDLFYLQDLMKLPMDTEQMKVTVRQLPGRPDFDRWQPSLEQLKETGIAKFLVDVKTENLDDFFEHVSFAIDLCQHSSLLRLSLGENRRTGRSLLRLRLDFVGKL